MKENKQKSYREIMKGTSIFGGIQIFQILINILRGKIVALYLGPEGMGISGLFISSLTVIITICGLGINVSSVRYLSAQTNNEDFNKKLQETRIIFFITALLGMLVTMVASFFLSQLSFKSSDFIYSYIVLSFYVFFTLFNSGYNSIFQSVRKLKVIAFANFLPSLIALFATFPLYYFFRMKAVVPGIIAIPFFTFIYYEVVYNKTLKQHYSLRFKEIITLFKEYISLGIFLVIGVIVGNLITYLLNFFISHTGSVSDVGLFNAGISITNQYVGMLFTAMSVDYFPRLSGLINDHEKFNELISDQSEIIIFLAFPLLGVMIVTAPLMISILLSNDFMDIKSFITLISFGMIFKAFSYPYGYVTLAKNSRKTYFIFEVIIANIQLLILNVTGYYFYGLLGLAASFIINYIFYFSEIKIICLSLYKIKTPPKLGLYYFVSIITLFVMTILSFFNQKKSLYINIIIAILGTCYSIFELDKRINLFSHIVKRIKIRGKNE